MSHDWRPELETQHGVDRLKHWKKGNQRNSLLRVHAEMAVKDSQLVRAFTSICMHCQVSASPDTTTLGLMRMPSPTLCNPSPSIVVDQKLHL